ncbi:MAG: hypothetical protein PHI06_00925 [Desulfobulbaceae bacterium]|nr:hypothetical protein [Desulfobulbaceae bacterium]
MLRFFRMLIALRKRYSLFRRTEFFSAPHSNHPPEIIWQGEALGQENWSLECKVLCFTLVGSPTLAEPDFFVIVNSHHAPQLVDVPPPVHGRQWLQLINTAQQSPDDIVEECDAVLLPSASITVASMAVVVLFAKPEAS